jgi:hypothetical protein
LALRGKKKGEAMASLRGSRSLKEKVSAAGADPVVAAIIKATDSTVNEPKAKHVEGDERRRRRKRREKNEREEKEKK